jgi:hypothetical protein
VAVHGERDGARSVGRDRRAEFAQCGKQRPDRPLRDSRIAGEPHLGVGESGERRHEPQHVSGVADVDVDCEPGRRLVLPGARRGLGVRSG